MTKCNGGVVDVVSCVEVIEVKHWIKWKEGIGQVMIYALDFPDKKKRIHFFGQRPDQKTYDYIHSVCEQLGIIVTETKVRYNGSPPVPPNTPEDEGSEQL